jgi:hypothetical protein
MPKKRGSKGRRSKGLDTALQEYAKAEEELEEFEGEHQELVEELEDLQQVAKEAKARVETEALEASGRTEKGKYKLLEAHGFSVHHKVGARRKVDSTKLLQKYPDIWQWKGLLTVVVGKFDAAVESKQIDRRDIKTLVSTTPTDTIEIIEQEK